MTPLGCFVCKAEKISGAPEIDLLIIVREWSTLCAKHKDIALRQDPPHPIGVIAWTAGETVPRNPV